MTTDSVYFGHQSACYTSAKNLRTGENDSPNLLFGRCQLRVIGHGIPSSTNRTQLAKIADEEEHGGDGQDCSEGVEADSDDADEGEEGRDRHVQH